MAYEWNQELISAHYKSCQIGSSWMELKVQRNSPSAFPLPPLQCWVGLTVHPTLKKGEGVGGGGGQREWTWIIGCEIGLLQCLHIIRVCLLLYRYCIQHSSVSCHCVQESVDVDLRAWNTRVDWHAVLSYTSRWKGDPRSPWPGIPNWTSDCL